MRLAVLEDPPNLRAGSRIEVVLDAVYRDALPSSATVEAYAAWIGRTMTRRLPSGPVGVEISISDGQVNLGDVGTGPGKVLIDGMWPLLGGRRGAPDDGRVTALIIRKRVADLGGAVRIQVMALS